MKKALFFLLFFFTSVVTLGGNWTSTPVDKAMFKSYKALYKDSVGGDKIKSMTKDVVDGFSYYALHGRNRFLLMIFDEEGKPLIRNVGREYELYDWWAQNNAAYLQPVHTSDGYTYYTLNNTDGDACMTYNQQFELLIRRKCIYIPNRAAGWYESFRYGKTYRIWVPMSRRCFLYTDVKHEGNSNIYDVWYIMNSDGTMTFADLG